MKYNLERLNYDELKEVEQRIKSVKRKRAVKNNAAQVASIIVGLGLLPLAIRLDGFGGWLAVALAIFVLFTVGDLLKRPARVEHTGNTQPLPRL